MDMIRDKRLLIGYRLFFGLLVFSAVITEIATIVERGQFNPINFFSYFTIETNMLVVVTLLLSAIAVAMGRNSRLDVLRGAVTVYALIVGIGFSVLLAGIEGVALTAVPWDNTVLHYIMPVAMFVDYLVDRPGRKLQFKKSLVWLAFPIIYVTYSLVRGILSGWYPYPFLNPESNGYGDVVFTVLCLLAVAVSLIWVVTKMSGKRKNGRG